MKRKGKDSPIVYEREPVEARVALAKVLAATSDGIAGHKLVLTTVRGSTITLTYTAKKLRGGPRRTDVPPGVVV